MTYDLTADHAARFARIALGHVTREYPHKADHVMTGDADVYTPRAVHPIFYGSFDWHSCVHGYWLLARVRRLFPDLAEAAAIDALFADAFTPAKVEAERAYLDRPSARGFERPYGWAWLLMLAAELVQAGSPHAATLRPLADAFVARFRDFLPLLTYPVRAGQHANTGFALVLAVRYAEVAGDTALRGLLTERAHGWFGADRDAQAWEPSGEDFLSPILMEATAMAALLPRAAFAQWFAAFRSATAATARSRISTGSTSAAPGPSAPSPPRSTPPRRRRSCAMPPIATSPRRSMRSRGIIWASIGWPVSRCSRWAIGRHCPDPLWTLRAGRTGGTIRCARPS